jgi:hypothetical protein
VGRQSGAAAATIELNNQQNAATRSRGVQLQDGETKPNDKLERRREGQARRLKERRRELTESLFAAAKEAKRGKNGAESERRKKKYSFRFCPLGIHTN